MLCARQENMEDQEEKDTRFNLRLPSRIMGIIVDLAHNHSRTVTSEIVWLLEKAIAVEQRLGYGGARLGYGELDEELGCLVYGGRDVAVDTSNPHLRSLAHDVNVISSLFRETSRSTQQTFVDTCLELENRVDELERRMASRLDELERGSIYSYESQQLVYKDEIGTLKGYVAVLEERLEDLEKRYGRDSVCDS